MTSLGNAAMSRLAMLSGDARESDAYGELLPMRPVPVSDIEPHPDNRDIDRAHVARLADDIAEIGLGQPVLVRPLPGAPGRWQCIVGHHRVEAFKLLDSREPGGRWSAIPAVVCDYDDDRALRMLVDSNLHSRPLSREELGREMLRLEPVVKRLRAEQPERYAGVRTSQVMRDIYNEGAPEAGKISTRTVERGLEAARAARHGNEGGDGERDRPTKRAKSVARRASEAKRAAEALVRKLQEILGDGRASELDPDVLDGICAELDRAVGAVEELRARRGRT